jgi:GH24 family phage-related lysozyme (muramidase)
MSLIPTSFTADIRHWEGSVPWLYLDTRGFVTVAVGNLLSTASAAMALPFVVDRNGTTVPAFSHEINDDYARVSRMSPGLSARAYRSPSSPILLDEDIDILLNRRLTSEFLPGLERMYPGFDRFPRPAQSALLDLAFNLGLGGLGKFHRLGAAVARRDWDTAAIQSSRRTSRPERNEWTAAKFRHAAGEPVA